MYDAKGVAKYQNWDRRRPTGFCIHVFGDKAAELALQPNFGNMVAKRGEQYVPVPLSEVAGNKRLVPLDHPLVEAARAVYTCLGDRVESIPANADV